MLYFLLLNGPPSVGKSTLARCALRTFKDHNIKVDMESIAGPMKQFVAALLGQPYSTINKARKLKYANDEMVREFLINLSEDYLIKRYGNAFFPRALLDRWRSSDYSNIPHVLVVDDCGFQREVAVLPADRCYIVRLLRPGFTFLNDSREYLPNPHRRLSNDGTLQTAEAKMRNIVEDMIEKFKLKGLS